MIVNGRENGIKSMGNWIWFTGGFPSPITDLKKKKLRHVKYSDFQGDKIVITFAILFWYFLNLCIKFLDITIKVRLLWRLGVISPTLPTPHYVSDST